jgi:streptomycin 6-kinase
MPSGADWLDTLPGLVGELLDRWTLRHDGAARHGYAALVLPVRREDGTPAALKITWPHREARDEHRTLTLWSDGPAVRLLAADPTRWALLLERLTPDRDLGTVDPITACGVIGDLLRRLDRPAPPWAERAGDHLLELAEDIDRLRACEGVQQFPRRLLDQGRATALELAAEPNVDARLLHTDLHQHNVLWRPDPGEWVAIDPKPMAADPLLGLAPALWNQWPEAVAAVSTRAHLRRRLDVLCERAGLDRDRADAFALVRLVRNAVWDLQDPAPMTPDDSTQIVTIIKALQPA